MTTETIEIIRARRVTLAPTKTQAELIERHAGAAIWAYNQALRAKIVAYEIWKTRVAELVNTGLNEKEARKRVKVRIPNSNVIDKARVRVRGTDRYANPRNADWTGALNVMLKDGIDDEVATAILTAWAERVENPTTGIAPWLSEVPNSLVQRAQVHADRAWKAWIDSFQGKRAGRRVGFPRYHRHGDRDSFYLVNTEAGLVPGSHRKVRLGGKIGEVNVCDADGKRALRLLTRAVNAGNARILSVTVSRVGHRWQASILAVEQVPKPTPTRRAREAGTVGVHLGVNDRATLSTGEVAANPGIKITHTRRVVKARQALSRTGWTEDENGNRIPTKRRIRARRRLARASYEEALARGTAMHHLSKQIATGFDDIAMLDIGVQDMTRSAHRHRPPLHGWDAKAKRDANRELLGVAPFALRTQIQYKATWAGANVHIVPRGVPVTRTCSRCGAVTPPFRDKQFTCTECGLTLTRGLNASRVLAGFAIAARNEQEAQNARQSDDTPPRGRQRPRRKRSPEKREDPQGPPSGGDPGTST